MKRVLLILSIVAIFGLLAKSRSGMRLAETGSVEVSEGEKLSPATEDASSERFKAGVLEGQISRESAPPLPASRIFPSAKVVSRVSSSLDRGEGERVVETLETNMKQPYVRIERIFKKNLDGKLLAQGEVAMVANQVMLQRPETLEPQAMDKILREAGAREVRDLGNDSFLATFDARPEDPLALDGYLKQVKEVAGADVPVEPNYIRKLF